jgi:hypothetical protein
VSGTVGDVTGSKILSGTDFAQRFGIRNEKNDFEAFPISLEKDFAESSGSARGKSTAFVSVAAHAETGSLRVDVSGDLGRDSSATSQIGEAQLISAIVQARWQDTTILSNRLNPMPGRLIHLKSVLELDGNVVTSVLGTPPSGGSRLAASQVSLSLAGGRVLGVSPLPIPPYDSQYFAESHASTSLTVGVTRPAPEMIDVNLFATEGELFTMDILMEARASGTARCNSYFSAFGNSFSTSFSASFGHTLRWGGITSVTDAQTGEPIEGWVITSASARARVSPHSRVSPASQGGRKMGRNE